MSRAPWIAALVLAGCQATTPAFPVGSWLVCVPAGSYPDRLCGAAALRDVLAHHGRRLALDEIAREVFDADLGGTSNAAMLAFLDRRGIAFWAGRGTGAVLESALRHQRPPIVFLAPRNGACGHYAVVHGWTAEPPAWVLGAPHGGRELALAEDFALAWRRGHGWTLVIDPDERARASRPGAHP